MKAFYATAYGGPEIMRYGDLPDPSPRRSEVLVAVRAASVNPLDYKIRRGDFRMVTGRGFPKVLGADFAGTVAALGPGVSDFGIGARVYGITPLHLRRPGAHAELLPVAAGRVRAVPGWISFEEAASLPVAALSAQNGLRRCGPLAGKAVLVNGATGGVGHFAVQMAKAGGATVTAVCSARNGELARSLGADTVIDYAREDPVPSGASYDVIFDAHGGVGFARARSALASKGIYATTLPTPAVVLSLLWRKLAGGRRIVPANMRARPEDYAALERRLECGAVRPIIGEAVPLREAARAFACLEGGRVRGKVVIRIE
jgi:NADPH:quinone reductase-like Zn-dependent oxidoreductase